MRTLEEIDFHRLFRLIDSLGSQLDERKGRFDKADIIEQAIEDYSGGALKWVDLIGLDHVDIDGIRYEVKSEKNCLYTKIQGLPKEKTSAIKLVNTLSQKEDKSLSETADYLLIIDTGSPKSFAAAVVPYKTAIDNAKRIADGFTIQLDRKELTFLFKPSDYTPAATQKNVNYLEEKRKAQQRVISRF